MRPEELSSEIDRVKKQMEIDGINYVNYARIISKDQYRLLKAHAEHLYKYKLPEVENVSGLKLFGFNIIVE